MMAKVMLGASPPTHGAGTASPAASPGFAFPHSSHLLSQHEKAEPLRGVSLRFRWAQAPAAAQGERLRALPQTGGRLGVFCSLPP